MIKVGLTGGIGSGKTTVARVFEVLGVPVYYADKEAKRLMIENSDLRIAIQQEFGKATYNTEGIDREYLAKIVFKDARALAKLNSLVHPVVRQDFKEWAVFQKVPYVIQESAILFETGLYLSFDKIISVLSPMEERLVHLLLRDKSSKEQIQARMNAQVSDKIRQEKSDYILQNSQEDLLLPQIIKIDRELRT